MCLGKHNDITYNWNLIYSTNERFQRKENHRLVAAPGEREGEEGIGSLGKWMQSIALGMDSQ